MCLKFSHEFGRSLNEILVFRLMRVCVRKAMSKHHLIFFREVRPCLLDEFSEEFLRRLQD